MFALLSPRLWIALALAAALAFTHGMAYRSGRAAVRTAWDAEKAQQVLALAEATAAARTREQNLQRTKDEAVNAAAQREKTLRADAGRARSERDGLRSDLATARANLSSASPDSLRKRVTAAEDVFEQCVREYSGLAEEADRQSSDAVMLRQAWPK